MNEDWKRERRVGRREGIEEEERNRRKGIELKKRREGLLNINNRK